MSKGGDSSQSVLVEAVKDKRLGIADLGSMIKQAQAKVKFDMNDAMNACCHAADNVSTLRS